MRRVLLLLTLPVAMHAIPVHADEAEDRLICADSAADMDERTAACTRLAETGDAEANRTMAVSTFLPRGNVLLLDQAYEAAVAEFDSGLILDDANAALHRGRGEAFLAVGEYREAALALARVVELGEATAWDYIRLGIAFDEIDEPELALTAFDAGLALRPENGWAYMLRGDVHDGIGHYEEAIADYTSAIDTILSATLYSRRGWAYRGIDDYDSQLRDLSVAYLLDPNLLHSEWTAGYETLWPRFIDEHWPPLTVPADPPPLEWEAPDEGLRVTYIRVENEDRPVDPMVAAIDDLIAWFVYIDQPLPIEATVYAYDIGATDNGETAVIVTDVYEQSPIRDEVSLALRYSALATSQSFGPLPALRRSYGDALNNPWPMQIGNRLQGEGAILVTCPAALNPMTMMVGCLEGVAESTVGRFSWSLTFEGWEDLVVPAGRLLAARVNYAETASMTVMGQTRSTESTIDWWFDPAIDWWVRRKRSERETGAVEGTIEVLEAIEIVRPD